MLENEDAELVFFAVQNQYIIDPRTGPVSLNQVAVHEAMRLYGVDDPLDCFEKVVVVSQRIINEMRERK